MAADTSGTKIQPMCIYQSLIDGFRRVKEKSCFRSTPFPFSIPPSTMIILYHFSADKSISNSSSLARTSARKLDLCVKIKHLAKDYVKNGKSGRRVVVAKADHSMDAVYLSLSLSLFILSPRRSLKSKKTYKYSRMLIILLFVLPMNLLCFTMCPPADLTLIGYGLCYRAGGSKTSLNGL